MFVKIDGITCEEDARLAVTAGADAVGFVFAPSVRQVTPDVVREIVRGLPDDVLTVGVFVNEPRDQLVETVNELGLRAAQLHGNESVEETQWIRARTPMVFKAFAAGDPALERAADYGAGAVVVDTPGGGGGSGVAYDWSRVGSVPPGVQTIVAGGLTPENVSDAIEGVRPWGVDVSSGVESTPGRKDAAKLRSFIAAAKSAFPVGNADKREELLQWLGYLRRAVLRNVDGIDDAQSRVTPDGALIPLLGIIHHLTRVEWRWIEGGFRAAAVERSEEEFRPGPAISLAQAVDAYIERARATDVAVRSIDLDRPSPPESWADGHDLRWVLLHLINETARHCGHADATRELLDGTTGE